MRFQNALIAQTLDGTGIYGEILHFAFAAFFFGGALMIFIYLWRKGRLDMDEDPARRMLEDDPEDNKKQSNDKEKGDEPRT